MNVHYYRGYSTRSLGILSEKGTKQMLQTSEADAFDIVSPLIRVIAGPVYDASYGTASQVFTLYVDLLSLVPIANDKERWT